MRDLWIDNYAGRWIDDSGRVLVITVRDQFLAKVTLLVNGIPMPRPWCGEKPAKDMPARYSPVNGPGLSVALGRAGFTIELNYEFPDEHSRYTGEELSVGIGSLELDEIARKFISVFCPLGRYRRDGAEPVAPPDRR